MESYFEDGEEDREFRARYERRQRMRLERQRRLRRQRMIKRALCLGILGMIIVLAGVAVRSSRKTKADENPAQEATAMGQSDGMGSIIEKVMERAAETGTQETGETETELSEAETTEAEEEPLTYSFAETPDTAAITSEDVISTNAVLVDESADTIVASKGAKERILPASMKKVLTILVAAEHISEEDLDDTFTMTLEITDYAYVNDCSSVGFLDGEEVTVRDLFYGTALHSGGDAALGLATYVAGSQEAFVEMMNQKLEELGIADSTHFTNCVGIYDEAHYSTVYDMAVIMKAAIHNDLCREFLSLHTYTTKPTEQHPDGIEISNWFLRKIEDKDTGGEVLCAKTGYIDQSKNCAVSYGTFAGGKPYICVTAASTSNWRCIYDHVEIYNRYVPST